MVLFQKMITITNPKIAGFEPIWAKFNGFSLLFDNADNHLMPMAKDLRKLDFALESNPDLRLFKMLADTVNSVGQQLLIHTYLFCPLPPSSYHVTVLDGLNEGNLHQVNDKHRPAIDDFLKNLPDSFLTNKRFNSIVEESLLLNRKDWNIQFKLDRLLNWGNQSVVASLLPVAPYSANYAAFVEEHRILAGKIRNEFGIHVSSDFYPHLTLGYFGNAQLAKIFTSQISEWTSFLKNEMAECTIAFNSISLYGFTDMITFFK